MKGTWETTSGGGTIALIAGVAILAVAIVGPVAAAAAELLRILVIAMAVVVVLALAAAAAVVAYRLRQRCANASAAVSPARLVPRRPADPLPAPRPRAIGGPREVHLHFHSISAEVIAGILAERNRPDGPHV